MCNVLCRLRRRAWHESSRTFETKVRDDSCHACELRSGEGSEKVAHHVIYIDDSGDLYPKHPQHFIVWKRSSKGLVFYSTNMARVGHL